MLESMVEIGDIEAAAAAMAGTVRLTPVWPSKTLADRLGLPVQLKCEQMQLTGSFKLRGALNFIAALGPEERERGVVACSAGNHAQGVAYAGRAAGVDVTVVMPAGAPLAKAAGARNYGARVLLEGGSLEAATSMAQRIAADEGRILVPPFDDDRIIATAIRARKPGVRVVGVQVEAMDGVRRSFLTGSVVTREHADTLADGVAVAGPSERTLALIRRHADDVIAVSEESIANAIVMLIERSKMVVEGAGALAVAALNSGVYRPSGPCVAVLSGGNIDINLLGTIVHHGLVEAGRYRYLRLDVEDTPGNLAAVTAVIAEHGGNVIEVLHKRESRELAVGDVILEFLLEVNGPEHYDEIVAALKECPQVHWTRATA